ncbi:orexigenic neuropeptide QRFP [Pelobates fuscus]|uniref:orexigenic neuropeptide QRFP n=1 Tax=Pelobates fuscus TaxID=191477 RepID=UPI002FE4C4B4
MTGIYGLSILVLIALGSSLALQESREQKHPWEKMRFWSMFPDEVEKGAVSLLVGGALRDKKYTDPASLFSVAKELQEFGKEKAGFRFRFGRREDGNAVGDFEPQLEEKRSGTPLGSLAEELNGYNRKKGGFSFRFGRR